VIASPRFACGRLLLLLAGLAAPTLASAAPAGLSHAQQAHRQALVQAYARLVDPSFGDVSPSEIMEGPSCLTVLVAELRASPELFDADEWLRIATTLELPLPGEIPHSSLDGDGTCTGDTGPTSKSSEHFVVYWDSSGTEAEADDMLAALEFSWQTEVEEQGWKPPAGTPDLKLRFKISNQNYAGAYTTVDWCSGVGYVPYFVAGRGSFSAGNWYKSMAAHEFNHSSQFSYGFAHEFFWWEATATYMEEQVYPAYNDWAEMYWAFSNYPYIGMNAFDQSSQEIFYHMYGMGIWGNYLDQYVGGFDLVQATWELVDGNNGQYDYWMPDVLADLGYDFDALFQGFMAATAFMDFDEPQAFYDPSVSDTVTSLPFTGNQDRDAPQSLGLNYFKIQPQAGASGKLLHVDFSGDDSVEWNVVLATGDSSSLADYAAVPVSGGSGDGAIAFDGDKTAFLVVSPKDVGAQGYSYRWTSADDFSFDFTLCLVDSADTVSCTAVADTGGDSGGDSGGDPPVTGGSDSPKGCGCASGGAAPAMGLAWSLGLLGLALRRRRS